jgi:hypothetical protein
MIQQTYVLRYATSICPYSTSRIKQTLYNNNASIIIISASRFMSGDAATLLFWCFLGRAAANAPAQPSPVAPSFPASSPKSAPVPVAATASPPSILSLAHVLGLVFASFFPSSSFLTYYLHSPKRLWLPTLAVHSTTLHTHFSPQTHIHWLSHERRQSQQL